MWIPVGDRCLSALAMEHNNLRGVSLPLDYLDCLPGQALRMFRNQFEDFYTSDYTNKYGIFFEHFRDKTHEENRETFRRRIYRFYEHLELPKKRTIFLHTTEIFLMRPFSGEEQVSYDEDLVSLCGYIERNFPDLDFTMIHLTTNRGFYGKHPRILPFVLWTPAGYASTLRKDMPVEQIYAYREAAYAWLKKILSLPTIKDDPGKETDHGTEITTDRE
jgi:hypothetical protein